MEQTASHGTLGMTHRGWRWTGGFYELPDRLADGSIRHINHDNLKLKNVMWATALDFGRKYREFADYLSGQEAREENHIFYRGSNPEKQEITGGDTAGTGNSGDCLCCG